MRIIHFQILFLCILNNPHMQNLLTAVENHDRLSVVYWFKPCQWILFEINSPPMSKFRYCNRIQLNAKYEDLYRIVQSKKPQLGKPCKRNAVFIDATTWFIWVRFENCQREISHFSSSSSPYILHNKTFYWKQTSTARGQQPFSHFSFIIFHSSFVFE